MQGELWQPPVYEKTAEQKQQLRRVAQLQMLQWRGGAGQLGKTTRDVLLICAVSSLGCPRAAANILIEKI